MKERTRKKLHKQKNWWKIIAKKKTIEKPTKNKKNYWGKKFTEKEIETTEKKNDGKEKPGEFFFLKKKKTQLIGKNKFYWKKADWKTPTEKNLLKVRSLQKETAEKEKKPTEKQIKPHWKQIKPHCKAKKKLMKKFEKKKLNGRKKKKLQNTFQSRLKIKGKQKSLIEKRIQPYWKTNVTSLRHTKIVVYKKQPDGKTSEKKKKLEIFHLLNERLEIESRLNKNGWFFFQKKTEMKIRKKTCFEKENRATLQSTQIFP